MDNVTLKKKLSAYVSDKGYLKNVSDEIYFEVLRAWEDWTGPGKDFYRSLGFSSAQMASLIGKAKKMKRDGAFGNSEFKEIKIEPTVSGQSGATSPCQGAEVVWQDGRVIRFSQVDLLLEFLKKAA